jgi:glycosyltransferase involved in cell wall biosynthesis
MCMRVVQLGKYYFPHKGGIETQLRLLSRNLQGLIDVDVVVFNTSNTTLREMSDGVALTRCSSLLTLASTPISFSMACELSRKTYDVMHLHTPNPTAALAYLLSTKPEHALVISHHSDVVRQLRLKRLIEPIMRRVLERADAILVASPNYLSSSQELAPFRAKCHIVPYGLDLTELAVNKEALSAAATLRAQYRGRIVLSVGRLVYYKGFDVAIEAMQRIDATLLIVGEGPLHARLVSKVRSLNLDHKVVFAGNVEGSLLPYYLAADVFVLASIARSEAFGLVQLEAMACRVPVVNTSLDSGVPFVSRHGESGLTVPPGDADALSAAIRMLLEHEDLRREYGERGRARVASEFSIGSMCASTMRIYRAVSDKQSIGSRIRS